MKKKSMHLPTIFFTCRKCGHQLYLPIDKLNDTLDTVVNRLAKVSDMNCPSCGEEPYENWFLDRVDIPEVKDSNA